jgi:hypothetical protein
MVVLAEASPEGFESIAAFQHALRADRDLWATVLHYRRSRRYKKRLERTSDVERARGFASRRALLDPTRLRDLMLWSAGLDEDALPA